MYKRIVAGTDFSDTAKVATDRAAGLAERLGAELVLVHVGADKAREELESLAAEYGAQPVLASGSPADALVEEVERVDGDLLVVGSVGMTGAKRFLLGSVPNKVSHHARSDLLIVKTDPLPAEVVDYERILVGTDGSPTATRAVEMAASLAQRLGVKPLIITAYEPPSEAELERMRRSGDPLSQWNASAQERDVPQEFAWRIAGAAQAEDILERAQEHAARFEVDAEVRAIKGNPAEALIAVAEKEGFQLIVVGSVGMTGAKRFMLGNVPNRISHHAPTDVLILHTS